MPRITPPSRIIIICLTPPLSGVYLLVCKVIQPRAEEPNGYFIIINSSPTHRAIYSRVLLSSSRAKESQGPSRSTLDTCREQVSIKVHYQAILTCVIQRSILPWQASIHPSTTSAREWRNSSILWMHIGTSYFTDEATIHRSSTSMFPFAEHNVMMTL